MGGKEKQLSEQKKLLCTHRFGIPYLLGFVKIPKINFNALPKRWI